MKFGLAFASSIGIEADDSLEICRRAEAAGFESVWGGEHVILPTTIESPYPYTADGKIPAQPDTPIPDPLIWLAYVAAAAPTLRLGTCILIVPQRNPLVLAKELATLDRLSGGRVELGLGVGWMREEFDALGVPWDHRGARNDEYIAAMRALWAGPHAEFHGEFVDFPPVTCSPARFKRRYRSWSEAIPRPRFDAPCALPMATFPARAMPPDSVVSFPSYAWLPTHMVAIPTPSRSTQCSGFRWPIRLLVRNNSANLA